MKPQETTRLLPSLFDRLTDPDAQAGSISGYDHRKMMDVVRADLEDLLNTRRTCAPEIEGMPELSQSIAMYGLPDLSEYPTKSAQQLTALSQIVADIIHRFEPRLKNIRVVVVRDEGKPGHSVQFHIEAELNVNPAPEVSFSTVVELVTGRATVHDASAFAG